MYPRLRGCTPYSRSRVMWCSSEVAAAKPSCKHAGGGLWCCGSQVMFRGVLGMVARCNACRAVLLLSRSVGQQALAVHAALRLLYVHDGR